MAANEQRGELELEIGSEKYLLSPTFDAVARIEQRLGTGIYGLANKWIGKQDIGLAEATIVIHECMRGDAGINKAPSDLGKKIRAHGLGKLIVPLIKLIGNAIRGDAEQEPDQGEGKPVA